MAQPTSPVSPISYHNQRLVVTDSAGNQRKYRLVIHSKAGQVSLTPEQEAKAVKLILKILEESDLNKADVNLAQASIKGHKVTYKNKVTAKQPQKVTYQEFQQAIKPALEAIKNAAPPPTPPKVQDEKKDAPLAKPKVTHLTAPEVKSENANQDSRKPTLFTRVRALTQAIRPEPPKGAKTLEEISYLLDQVIAKEGKFKVAKDGLIYSDRSIGLEGQKGGKNSVQSLLFIFEKIQHTLDSKKATENQRTVITDILARLSEFDWAKRSIEKHSSVKSAYDKCKASLQQQNTKAVHLFTPRELFVTILNPESTSREDFLIGYRTVFDGDNYKNDGEQTFESRQAAKSLHMLNFFHEQLKTSPNKADENPEFLKLVKAWLSDDAFNGRDYLDKRVQDFLKVIIKEAPQTQARELQALLDKKIAGAKTFAELKPKANAIDWATRIEAIKQGKKEGTQELVQQLVKDVTTESIFRLHQLNLNELDPEKFLGPGFLGETNLFNNISYLVAREIVTPGKGVDPLESAKRMRIFFDEVLKELIKNEKYDAAAAINAGLNLAPVARLKLDERMPERKFIQFAFQFGQGKKEYQLNLARGNRDNLIPVIAPFRTLLSGLEDSMPARVTEKEVLKLNLAKIMKNAQIKRPILEAQRKIKPVYELNISGLKELLDKSSYKKENQVEAELLALSNQIVPSKNASITV